MNILIYKLRKEFRAFGMHYHRIMKTFEISFWYFNVIIMWGNEDELNAKYR